MHGMERVFIFCVLYVVLMELNIKASTDLSTMQRLVEGLKQVDECSGGERHSHYVLSENTTVTHIHKHTPHVEDFNRLHHHAPFEHMNFTEEELAATAEFTETPF